MILRVNYENVDFDILVGFLVKVHHSSVADDKAYSLDIAQNYTISLQQLMNGEP